MEFNGTEGIWETKDNKVMCNGITVASCQNYCLPKTEQRYNTKLIASSPEMFKFLLDIYEQEECISQSCHDELFKLLTKITQ